MPDRRSTKDTGTRRGPHIRRPGVPLRRPLRWRLAAVLGIVLLTVAGGSASASLPCGTGDRICAAVEASTIDDLEDGLLSIAQFITDVVMPIVLGAMTIGTVLLSRRAIGAFRRRQRSLDERWRALEEPGRSHPSPDVVLLTPAGHLGGPR